MFSLSKYRAWRRRWTECLFVNRENWQWRCGLRLCTAVMFYLATVGTSLQCVLASGCQGGKNVFSKQVKWAWLAPLQPLWLLQWTFQVCHRERPGRGCHPCTFVKRQQLTRIYYCLFCLVLRHIIFPFSLFTDLQCFLSRQVRPFFIFTDSYEPYIVPPSSDLCRNFYWIGKEAEVSTHQSWPGMRQRSRERWWRGSRLARSRRGKPRTHALRAPRAPACSDPGQRRSHGSGGRNIISHLWRVNQMNLYL